MCQHEGVAIDWNRSCRPLVSALSQAGHLYLALPYDGRAFSWSALALTHADAVLARDPSSPFYADAMESLVAEHTKFARAQGVHSSSLAAARQVLGGPSFAYESEQRSFGERTSRGSRKTPQRWSSALAQRVYWYSGVEEQEKGGRGE